MFAYFKLADKSEFRASSKYRENIFVWPHKTKPASINFNLFPHVFWSQIFFIYAL